MGLLLLDDVPLVQVEVAHTFAARSRGLLGRDGVPTGLVLDPASSVHTLGMRFAIDVAYVAKDGRILSTRTMARHRIGLPRPRCRWILEAEAGAFETWGIRPGRRLRVAA